MSYYGYIKDKDLHEHLNVNVYWEFSRYDKDGKETKYKGIESALDYSDDDNIVIIGDKNEFKNWRAEFEPKPESDE
jgi:hypothetical protein